jgi:hypothetical protein
LDFSSTHELRLVSKFEINRITRKLIKAILRFRFSFPPPTMYENNFQIFMKSLELYHMTSLDMFVESYQMVSQQLWHSGHFRSIINVCYAEKLTKCISIFTTVFGHLFCVTDVSVKTLKSFSIVKSLRSIFERSCLLRLSFSWYSFQASKSLVVSIYGQLFLSSVQLSLQIEKYINYIFTR